MNFEESLKKGYAKKIPVDKFRAKNLTQSAEQAIETAKTINLDDFSEQFHLREI